MEMFQHKPRPAATVAVAQAPALLAATGARIRTAGLTLVHDPCLMHVGIRASSCNVTARGHACQAVGHAPTMPMKISTTVAGKTPARHAASVAEARSLALILQDGKVIDSTNSRCLRATHAELMPFVHTGAAHPRTSNTRTCVTHIHTSNTDPEGWSCLDYSWSSENYCGWAV
jgi:hypothetical protein